MPKPRSHATAIAFVTGAACGIGKAIATRLAADGACVVVADLDAEGAAAVASIGAADVAIGVDVDVSNAEAIASAMDEAVLAFGGVDLVVNNAGLSLSKTLARDHVEADWDLLHDVMAKGRFLVAKAAARAMIEQALGGDIVYIASKNSVFAGRPTSPTRATKADQAHQVRLLAVELGEHGIRVNGINPDGVVRGTGIFAGGWGAQPRRGLRRPRGGARSVLRAAHDPQTRGAPRPRRGRRDRAHRRVICARPPGSHIPVDSGVAAAFLR